MNCTSNVRLAPPWWAAIVACALATAGRAEGDLRTAQPYILDSTSKAPTVLSSPAFAPDGTLYISVDNQKSVLEPGTVFALTPTSTSLQLKWRHVLGGSTHSSPTVGRDGTIFVGADDGLVYALDQDTGVVKKKFDANIHAGANSALIESTGALSHDGQTIYFGIEVWTATQAVGGGLLALRTSDLSERWYVAFGSEARGAPAVGGDGTIYIGASDDWLYAILPDQTLKWKYDMGDEIWGSPAIGPDGTIYIGSLGAEFTALTPQKTVKWTKPIIVRAAPIVGPDNTVYVGSFSDATFYALRGADGIERWHFTQQQNDLSITTAVPLARADGTIVYGGLDNKLRVFDPGGTIHTTPQRGAGTVLWDSGTVLSSPIDGSAAISPIDNSIWVVTRKGYVYGFSGDYPLSQYASWPMFQRDAAHTGLAPAAVGGGRLINVSSRAMVGPSIPFIAGLYASGPAAKTVLMRAVGPTLGVFGVNNAMPDPALSVHINPSVAPSPNDNWEQSDDPDLTRLVTAQVGAFALPSGSKDAALVLQVVPSLAVAGRYSMVVESPHGDSGVALAEIYDADPLDSPTRLVNLSTRGYAGTGENVLIAGFMIRNGSLPLLIRGVGPSLGQFGVSDTLQQPVVTVVDRDGNTVASNTGWGSNTSLSSVEFQFLSTAVGAFGLPDKSADSALIVTLQPDKLYTIKVTGVANTTGNAIVEIYDLSFQ